MSILHALILGIIQGLTEFLPVSSSGHLVIAQNLLGLDEALLEQAVQFDLVLHLGTVVAVLYCYWGDISNLITSLFRKNAVSDKPITDLPIGLFFKIVISLANLVINLPRSLFLKFVVSLAATAILALPMDNIVEQAFSNARFAAYGLFVTALILILSIPAKGKLAITDVNWLKAVIIGIGQGIAVLPGVSRSGTTIVTGMWLGLKPAEAARYSFILSAPTILFATMVKALDLLEGGTRSVSVACYFFGFLSSAIFGILAIKLLLKVVSNSKIAWFAIYCVIAGAVALAIIN